MRMRGGMITPMGEDDIGNNSKNRIGTSTGISMRSNCWERGTCGVFGPTGRENPGRAGGRHSSLVMVRTECTHRSEKEEGSRRR